MTMHADDRAVQMFQARFGGEPSLLARAPGRVNLIGEHTDYNDGFVLPIAMDRSTVIATAPRADTMVQLVSDVFADQAFRLDALDPTDGGWTRYVAGVAHVLGSTDRGWDGAVATDVPIGAGLSSSAALEVAATLVFNEIEGRSMSPLDVAETAQRAENQWVGVPTGILDQLTSAAGIDGSALLIDCRSLDIEPIPVPQQASIVVLDTMTRRELSSTTAYRERRAACARVADAFGVKALRDLSIDDLASPPRGVNAVSLRRAEHVVTENARTRAAAAALVHGDLHRLGELMDESHESLRIEYAVSSPSLDAIVTIARGAPGCFGARMTGAGFGGCAVALVDTDQVDPFVADVTDRYRAPDGRRPDVVPTTPGPGATIVPVS